MFVAPERKRSSVGGTGIQYLPGHVDKFIDLVVDTYLPCVGSVVDLGGGGLRFAVPAALEGRAVSVVDLDKDGLDIGLIVGHLARNGTSSLEIQTLSDKISTYHQNVFEFLQSTDDCYDLITAFRLLHFFSGQEVARFLELANQRLSRNGLLAFSAMSLFNLPLSDEFNEIYLHSESVAASDPYFRRFRDDSVADGLRADQNLPERFRCFGTASVCELAKEYKFDMILGGFPATKIIAGYVLKKVQRDPA